MTKLELLDELKLFNADEPDDYEELMSALFINYASNWNKREAAYEDVVYTLDKALDIVFGKEGAQ